MRLPDAGIKSFLNEPSIIEHNDSHLADSCFLEEQGFESKSENPLFETNSRDYECPIISLKQNLNVQLDNIKDTLKVRRQTTKTQLKEAIKKIEEEEKVLANISPKYTPVWRAIQQKTLFLSVMRQTLRQMRNYGLDTHRLSIENEKQRELGEVCSSKRRCYTKIWGSSDYDPLKPLRWFLVYPDSYFYRIHLFLMVMIMVYMCIFTPIDLAFDFKPSIQSIFDGIDLGTTLYFFLDMVLSFVTCFEENGQLVEDPKRIVKTYLSRWFILDAITVFPFDLFVKGQTTVRYRKLLKGPRLIRLMNSLFQNTESKKKTRSIFLDKLKLFFSSSISLSAFLSFIVIIGFIHISACLWCFLYSLEEGYSNTNWLSQ